MLLHRLFISLFLMSSGQLAIGAAGADDSVSFIRPMGQNGSEGQEELRLQCSRKNSCLISRVEYGQIVASRSVTRTEAEKLVGPFLKSLPEKQTSANPPHFSTNGTVLRWKIHWKNSTHTSALGTQKDEITETEARKLEAQFSALAGRSPQEEVRR